jgi:serine/threonine protein kinase
MLEAPTLTQEFLPQGPGTPLYAAPEQLRNEMPLIDWRTDQFGLALVLAECVLGFHPFGPEGEEGLAIARIARREPLPVRSREQLVQKGFGSLIRAMAPWPVQRYKSPADFVTALVRN